LDFQEVEEEEDHKANEISSAIQNTLFGDFAGLNKNQEELKTQISLQITESKFF
jgi:hypothetical protein